MRKGSNNQQRPPCVHSDSMGSGLLGLVTRLTVLGKVTEWCPQVVDGVRHGVFDEICLGILGEIQQRNAGKA
jgi:hypothetical protein